MPSADLIIAKAQSDALKLEIAPAIAAASDKATTKEEWLKTRVNDSKAIINNTLEKMAITPEADERMKMVDSVNNELRSLDGWVTPRPVDQKIIDAVIAKDMAAWKAEQEGKPEKLGDDEKIEG